MIPSQVQQWDALKGNCVEKHMFFPSKKWPKWNLALGFSSIAIFLILKEKYVFMVQAHTMFFIWTASNVGECNEMEEQPLLDCLTS